eukprot:1419928-Rhodomonas_salina.1
MSLPCQRACDWAPVSFPRSAVQRRQASPLVLREAKTGGKRKGGLTTVPTQSTVGRVPGCPSKVRKFLPQLLTAVVPVLRFLHRSRLSLVLLLLSKAEGHRLGSSSSGTKSHLKFPAVSQAPQPGTLTGSTEASPESGSRAESRGWPRPRVPSQCELCQWGGSFTQLTRKFCQ